MNELKFSALLSEFMEKASVICKNNRLPVVAEGFLVVVIEKITNTQNDYIKDVELLTVKDIVLRNFKNLNAARECFIAYLMSENKTAFLDDMYMKSKIDQSANFSKSKGLPEIDSVSLLMYILREPTATIKYVLEQAKPEDSKSIETEIKNVFDNPEEAKPIIDSKAQKDTLFPSPLEEEGIDLDIVEKTKDDSDKTANGATKSEVAALISDTKRIGDELKSFICGQDNAIDVFVTGYFQASMLSMIDNKRKRPRATFLFAGPPGVGKTFLAEKSAEALKLPFMRFDMSEYSDKEAVLEFCGSDKVYKNGKSGNVTSFVESNPKCVLLFDEIEKAHISVIHLFLQLLDAGRLRDNYTDKEVSFLDTIVIFTTNAGKQLYEESESGDFSSVSRKVIIKALEKDKNPETGVPFFPGAICSRFASGNVVMFNRIEAYNLREIAKKEIQRHAANLKNETGMELLIDERVYTALLFSEGSSVDARTIRGRAETFFNDELYELLRLVSSNKVATTVDNVETIKINVDLNNANSDIANLFESESKANALVFAGSKTVDFCKEMADDVEVYGAQTTDEAINVIKTKDIGFVLIDMKFGAPETSLYNLNIEDVESPARDFFKFLKEQRKGLPVYIVEDGERVLSEEEISSFKKQGVRDVLNLLNAAEFKNGIEKIAVSLHQQASMVRLAKENKLVSFETAQTISDDGKNAEIKLFDFKMAVAVDSEDAKNILSAVSKPNVSFEEVLGAQDAKKELKYFVEYLKNPKKYIGTGVKAPKGVLLYGPPGTGKTMLAKAMACEADVTFIASEGNEFIKGIVGAGIERVHELFRIARKYAPSILFIDEIDAIAKERRGGVNANSYGEETLTAFLTEMDGFVNDPSRPVFVLAATNFDVEPGGEKSLDPALMRRFDRRVYIDLPNKEDRIKFLKKKMAKNKALDISDEQIDNIAMRSTGMSLAQIDSFVELALRSAIRDGSTVVNDAILEEAFETFNSGETKKWDESQLERVARHEAGHALLYWLSGETPSYLTVVARGNHGGYMQHADNEGKALYTREELLANIRTSLGGRAAEIVCYGDKDGISTGASGDLDHATRVAQALVCSYGMDDEFGLAVVNGTASGAISTEIRNIVNRILKEQMQEAIRLITENRSKLDALVAEVIAKNHMNGDEINEVLSRA